MSGLFASMGFGLPGALAAALVYPERQIICVTGDGGLHAGHGRALPPALKYNLPVKVFIINNKRLGMIMQEQKVEGYPSSQTELFDYNFADFAEHAGGVGIKVTEPSQLEAAVEKALAAKKATVVDIDTGIDKGEKCSVVGCSKDAERSIPIDKAKSAGLNVARRETCLPVQGAL